MRNVVNSESFTLDDALSGGYQKAEKVMPKKETPVTDDSSRKKILAEAMKNSAKEEREEEVESLFAQSSDNKKINLMLTAAKVWSPMISVITSRSEVSMEDSMVELTQIVRSSTELVTHLVEEIKHAGLPIESEKHRWVLRQILATVSENLSNQYRHAKKIDIETTKELFSHILSSVTGKLPKDLSKGNEGMVSDLIASTREKMNELSGLLSLGEKDDFNPESESAITCSIMKAMQPVVTELEWFSWFTAPEAHSHRLAEMLVGGAGFIYEKIMDGEGLNPSRSSKVMVLQSALDKAGQSLASAYKRQALLTLSEMKDGYKNDGSTANKRTVVNRVKHAGIPFEEINKDFEKSLGLHVSLTKSGAEFLNTQLGGLVDGSKKSQHSDRGRHP